MHFSSFVFIPLCDLSTCTTTVADRLFVEAQAITLWKPTLNVQGTPGTIKYSNEFVSLVFPRRVQDRPLMHARGVVQQDPALLFPPSAILAPRERPDWLWRLLFLDGPFVNDVVLTLVSSCPFNPGIQRTKCGSPSLPCDALAITIARFSCRT